MLNYELNKIKEPERPYNERLSEAVSLGWGDDAERLGYKDHGSGGGCLAYYGERSEHRIELTHPEKEPSPGLNHLSPAAKRTLTIGMERLCGQWGSGWLLAESDFNCGQGLII